MTADVVDVRFRSDGLDLYGRLRPAGDGAPTVVLLSGLGFHTFEYEPLAALLHAEGFNCLSFDYRGHGRSGGPRGRWLLGELVDDTREAIAFARARHPGPVFLFGNSLGGMVGVLAAADGRVRAVAAANCPARARDFLLTPPRRLLFAVGKAISPAVPLRISVNHFYSYDTLIADRSVVASIESDAAVTDARRLSIATYETLLEGWDGCAAVARLHKPLLLIQGARDRMQPPRQSQLLFAAANEPKRYETLDSGHLPHLEVPERLAALLTSWFSALAAGPDGTDSPDHRSDVSP